MKIAIFAATGRIGGHVLQQAVTAGQDVTAVVRDPRKLSGDVLAVEADLGAPDPAALEFAVEGADAVLSCLGPRRMAEVGIASQAPGQSSERCWPRRHGASSSSAPRLSEPCLRPGARTRRSMTGVTGSS